MSNLLNRCLCGIVMVPMIGCAGETGASGTATTTGSGGAIGDAGSGGSPDGGGFGFDAGQADADAASGERVSSLALEQVWYLTRSLNSDLLIDFRTVPPTVTCNGSVGSSDGFEGTGVFTEPATGDLYFYTDGRSVFNGATNQLLANGSGLNGHASATEPALIAPKLGSDDQGFYIFTNETNVQSPSSVSYSEIDLSLGPNGTVTTKNVSLLSGNPGEALDLLPHTNESDFWVVLYDGADTIKAFLVDQAGVGATPLVSSTGLSGQVMRGAINHTLDYDTLVLAQNYGGANGTIATAAIDRGTGQVSTATIVATGDVGYHASFSAEGRKLYYVRGTEGWSGQAYQYDLDTTTETLLGGQALGAAKLAPDGKLYWAGVDDTHLGVVNLPDAAGTAANYVVDGLFLEGCTAGFGVPNQTASYLDYLPPKPPE
jgi:hypothetical protein